MNNLINNNNNFDENAWTKDIFYKRVVKEDEKDIKILKDIIKDKNEIIQTNQYINSFEDGVKKGFQIPFNAITSLFGFDMKNISNNMSYYLIIGLLLFIVLKK